MLCHTFQKKKPVARRNTEYEPYDNPPPPSPPMSCVTDISDGEYNSEDEESCYHSNAAQEKS